MGGREGRELDVVLAFEVLDGGLLRSLGVLALAP